MGGNLENCPKEHLAFTSSFEQECEPILPENVVSGILCGISKILIVGNQFKLKTVKCNAGQIKHTCKPDVVCEPSVCNPWFEGYYL